MSEYFSNINTGATTIGAGMAITLRHFFNALKRKGDAGIDETDYFKQVDGLVTLQYPREVIPTPAIGRYRLYNNIDDCIGCMQCERACPVECITGTRKEAHVIDQDRCVKCGQCFEVCRFDAVERV